MAKHHLYRLLFLMHHCVLGEAIQFLFRVSGLGFWVEGLGVVDGSRPPTTL